MSCLFPLPLTEDKKVSYNYFYSKNKLPITNARGVAYLKNLRCWAEVNLDNIAHNYHFFKDTLGGEIIAVVKADAYGHGAAQVSERLEKEGCRFFAVSNIEEALFLRQKGVKGGIILLGFTPLPRFYAAYKNDITLCVNSLSYARELDSLAKKLSVKVKCQIKLDTGMGRIGFDAFDKNILGELKSVYALNNLEITGVFSHFSSADGGKKSDIRYTNKQKERFGQILLFLKENGLDAGLCHQANSAAALSGNYNVKYACRIGLGLYGLSPSKRFNAFSLKPAMELKAWVVFVKLAKKGRAISYGRQYVTKKPTKIATVSIGYADGYDRRFSKGGVMSVGGKRSPVIGRVTMDMAMLDVSDAPCKAGDAVTVFGENALTISNAAQKLKTIPYEIICGISSRVKRIYKGD